MVRIVDCVGREWEDDGKEGWEGEEGGRSMELHEWGLFD